MLPQNMSALPRTVLADNDTPSSAAATPLQMIRRVKAVGNLRP